MDFFALIRYFFIPFFAAAALTIALVPLVKTAAVRFSLLDRPEADPGRKIHNKPVPLLGGVALFLSMALLLVGYTIATNLILGGSIRLKHILGIIIAGALLMIGGFLDDKYNIHPLRQIFWPLAAIAVVIASGIGISYVTNPLGNTFQLEQWSFTLFSYNGSPYKITILADLFTFCWLLGTMYTTKLLDGLDGLVSGVGVIGAVALFALSLTPEVMQPETALIAALFGGACLGFLKYNFSPAQIYLGEGGSLFVGFMLGLLAIISGGKIATALLILGLPMLDVLWTIVRRLTRGKSPFHAADKKHLHHRFLAAGYSQRQTVLILYVLTATFGLFALILRGQEKLWALLTLSAVMLVLAAFLIWRGRKRGVLDKKAAEK